VAKTTTLTDDIDGSAGAQERKFSIGGTDYAIDLNDDNYAKLLAAVGPFRDRARIARKTRVNRAPVVSPEDRVKIRAWAEENGKPLAARGRFPNALVREYYDSVANSNGRSLIHA
jgi:hypothetical protein